MCYCPHCGHPVRHCVPAGDNRPRAVCDACGAIHYENPKLVLGCVAEWQGRVLLCRRAIAPRLGRWTLPAGFMENGESTQAAALRETLEEACAQVRIEALFALVDIPAISQTHLFYRGTLTDGQHAPGVESLETALWREEEIPWAELAFPSVRFCLERYFADRRRGAFGTHVKCENWPPEAGDAALAPP
ncbi:MAG: NUDIX hydrolase [Zoogloeaceae bacterium]|nr:NUDIX hydrolase [Zoogloeaceae bacterium]